MVILDQDQIEGFEAVAAEAIEQRDAPAPILGQNHRVDGIQVVQRTVALLTQGTERTLLPVVANGIFHTELLSESIRNHRAVSGQRLMMPQATR